MGSEWGSHSGWGKGFEMHDNTCEMEQFRDAMYSEHGLILGRKDWIFAQKATRPKMCWCSNRRHGEKSTADPQIWDLMLQNFVIFVANNNLGNANHPAGKFRGRKPKPKARTASGEVIEVDFRNRRRL